MINQPPRVIVTVIHPVQHHVFKCYPFRIRYLGVTCQRTQQFFDVPALVDWHQTVAHIIRGRMEGDRQLAPDLFCRARNLRHHPAGRQRDPAAGQLYALGVHHDLHRVAHVIKVIQRLAHPHQYDIAEQPGFIFGRARHRPFAQIVPRHHHLSHDFAGGQVAYQLLRAGMAERTG